MTDSVRMKSWVEQGKMGNLEAEGCSNARCLFSIHPFVCFQAPFAQPFRARNFGKARMKRRTRWLLAFGFFPTGLAETVVRILMVFIQSFFVCTVRTFIVTTTSPLQV